MTSPVSPSETIAKAMEGVTAEEWIVNGDRFSVETNATYIPDQKVIALCATGEGARARSLYIAACNPVAMREVLDELYALRETAIKLEAMQREMAELRHIGSQMANVLHHWKQRRDIAEYDRKQMAELQQLWDAIPSARKGSAGDGAATTTKGCAE